MDDPPPIAPTQVRFTGRIVPDSFAAFARHRAARLSLGLTVLALDSRHAVLAVAGPAILVDAFALTLSLGPADCLIDDVGVIA